MMLPMSSPVNRLLPVPARSCRDVARPSPLLRTLFAAGATIALALPAAAQQWPARGITVVSPFAPGGANDLIARTMSAKLAEALGVAVTVENRGGAGATLGTAHVARAAPDGYTLLVAGQSSLAFAPHLYSKLPYDSLRDFAPIMNVALGPYALTVNARVPAKSVAELMKIARSKPQALTFATSGAGSVSHLTMETLASSAGLDLVHVPYKGMVPAIAAMTGGEVDMMFNGISSALPQVRAGKLRALAMAGTKRSNLLPELPTIQEAGFKYDTSGWYGFVGPAGLPKPIVARLNEALVKTLASAEVRERFSAQGIDGIGSTPAAFADFLREEMAKWRKVIVASGLKGD